jgi:hypothetical protein
MASRRRYSSAKFVNLVPIIQSLLKLKTLLLLYYAAPVQAALVLGPVLFAAHAPSLFLDMKRPEDMPLQTDTQKW